MKSGFGSFTVTLVSSLVAVNAFGDVRDPATSSGTQYAWRGGGRAGDCARGQACEADGWRTGAGVGFRRLTDRVGHFTLEGRITIRFVSSRMTVTIKNKLPLVVPEQVRRRAGFKTGDQLEFRVSSGVVTILSKPSASGRVPGPDDVLTPAEAKRLRQSLKQTRQGKTRPWDEIKHELGL
jgi:bifunctional DNA-binding transcriptional regulator/antitoxin component of YhaV-PrlF toxin-antitoxin module